MTTLQGFLVAMALATLAGGVLFAAEPIRVEAEDGTLHGKLQVATTRPSFSGTGYVWNFRDGDDRLEATVQSPGGIYQVVIRHACPGGPKGYVLEVNGLAYSGGFPATGDAFNDYRAGRVELQPGENALAIHGGWRFYEIDRIDLVPAVAPPPPKPPAPTLVNPDATPQARALMRYLVEQYGRGTLTGVIAGEEAYVREVTGRSPAIVSGDVMYYSTLPLARLDKPATDIDRLLSLAKEGHVVTVLWHWYAPQDNLEQMLVDEQGKEQNARWYKAFYTYATRFDVHKALADEQSEDYQLLIRDIDLIAEQLKRLQAANVPVLWRPLHESEGKWFWWGAKGPEPFKQLWRILYQRLTHHHGLDNLIWVYTGTPNLDWYPGDDVVDIIGADLYPSDVRDPLGYMWDDLHRTFGDRKLVALTEVGGVPDVDRLRRLGIYWSYFASWSDHLGPKNMNRDDLVRIYNSPGAINREQLPRTWDP
jgi:mannan endo-1,4-beta-mannosidase